MYKDSFFLLHTWLDSDIWIWAKSRVITVYLLKLLFDIMTFQLVGIFIWTKLFIFLHIMLILNMILLPRTFVYLLYNAIAAVKYCCKNILSNIILI